MNITEKQRLLKQQLVHNLTSLDKSIETLRYSESLCTSLVDKATHTPEELEHLEALTARFARTSDILTQRVLKSLFLLLGDRLDTILDTANYAEKLGLIEHADDLIALRAMRNEISHEYTSDALNELFSETIRSLPKLYAMIQKIKIFVEEKLVIL